MAESSLDTFLAENTLQTDLNSVYEAFVTILVSKDPDLRYQIEYVLRHGYPIASIKPWLSQAFTRENYEQICRALQWKQNRLMFSKPYFIGTAPRRQQ